MVQQTLDLQDSENCSGETFRRRSIVNYSANAGDKLVGNVAVSFINTPNDGFQAESVISSAITTRTFPASSEHVLATTLVKPNRFRRVFRSVYGRHVGSWLSAVSSFFFSWQAVSMKKVVTIRPYELVIFQSGLQAIPSAIILIAQRRNPFARDVIYKSGWKLVLRGLLGGSATLLRIIAVQNVAMGEVSTLLFSSPVIVALLAPCLLKEKLSKYTLLALALTMCGLVLVVQPEFVFGASHVASAAGQVAGNISVAERNVGLGCAVGAAGVGAGISLVLRSLRHENEHIVMFWYGIIAVMSASVVTASVSTFKMPGWDWYFVGLAGGFQYFSQIFQTVAYQLGDSAIAIAVVRTTELIWAYMWQVIVFKESVNLIALAGSALILSSILVITYEKFQTLRKEKKSKGKTFLVHKQSNSLHVNGVVATPAPKLSI